MEKYEKLRIFFKGVKGAAAIACSGGVDSLLLLYTAVRWCSGPVLALMADSVFMHPDDIESVIENTQEMGVKFMRVRWAPLSYPEIVRNDSRRCYYCKYFMYEKLLEACRRLNISYLMDGTHIGDLAARRPGLQAITELGIITPFAQFLLDKQDIRHISLLKLQKTWNRRSQSCLATRIETGNPIREEELVLVKEVETMLLRTGIRGSRFRINSGEALLSVPELGCSELKTEIDRVKTVVAASGLRHLRIVTEF